jgi:hypothetical protein
MNPVIKHNDTFHTQASGQMHQPHLQDDCAQEMPGAGGVCLQADTVGRVRIIIAFTIVNQFGVLMFAGEKSTGGATNASPNYIGRIQFRL